MPNPDFTQALNWGQATLDLWDYDVQEVPQVKAGIGRISTTVTIKADCYCDGTGGTAEAFAIKLAQTYAALRTDGQDVIINGIGGNREYTLTAAISMDGGPHITIDSECDVTALSRHFNLSIVAAVIPQTGPTNSYSVRKAIRPDGLSTVTWSGQVIGPNASDYLLSTVIPAAKRSFPWPGWVLNYETDSSMDANLMKSSYQIVARENYGKLPSSGAGDIAVDGEVTKSVSTDEHHRYTSTLSFDLLVQGDPIKLLISIEGNALRPIFREQWSITGVSQQRLSGSITSLTGADAGPLMDFENSVELLPADEGWELHTYPGASPIVVRKHQSIARIVQSGTAVADRRFKKPNFLMSHFLGAPTITLGDENDVEKKTTWRATMFPAAGDGTPDGSFDLNKFNPDPLGRPAQDDGYYGLGAGAAVDAAIAAAAALTRALGS